MVPSRADGHFGSVFRLGPLHTRTPPRNLKEKTKKKLRFAPRFLSSKTKPRDYRLIRTQQSTPHVVTQTLPRKSKQSGETSGGSGRIRATVLSLVTVVRPETNLPSKFRQKLQARKRFVVQKSQSFPILPHPRWPQRRSGVFSGARSQEPGARRPTQLPQED